MKTADIIIPVFNERDNLPALLQRLRAMPEATQWHLIFVDNASTDGSVEYLSNISEITLIRHDSNRGYGASLRSGMAAAQTEQWVIIDADCEYPPECIPELLTALQSHPVVYASRLLRKKSAQAAGMPYLKWWGNRLISSAYNQLFQQRVTDLYTGCKAMQKSCMQDMVLQRDGFEQVLELAVKLSDKGVSIAEIPVDFSPRSHGTSKMSHAVEVVKYGYWLLYYAVQHACMKRMK
jgi:glycosyltransferase involved in cell wall biosynthesis